MAVPAVLPVITPVVAPTVMEPVPAEVVQVPPANEFVAVTVALGHTANVPPMADGIGFTVTVVTDTHPKDVV